MTSPLVPTPGQTVGPFFGFALPYAGGADLVPPGAPGAVRLSGRVLDGDGAPVPDALLEIWQPAPDGGIVRRPGSLRRDGWTFTGWGRSATDTAGRYAFTTLEPGGVDGGAAFFTVAIFARGLLDRLFTRAYLPDDEPALGRDRLLSGLPGDRRQTLVARREGRHLVFDVVLQGDRETVFLAYPGQPTR
jgi:protocatechuate 3,4-dioxygenase alpha subunit